MKTTKQRRDQLAAIRQVVIQDLKKIYDLSDTVDLLKEILRNPSLALDHFYSYRDRRDCYVRLLQKRIKSLMTKKLLSRSFGKMILDELEQIH